jgi:hypothetical protein
MSATSETVPITVQLIPIVMSTTSETVPITVQLIPILMSTTSETVPITVQLIPIPKGGLSRAAAAHQAILWKIRELKKVFI